MLKFNNIDDCKEYAQSIELINQELNKKLLEVNLKLRQSEKLKSNFLSNVRNEVNNPLTSSLGLAQNLKKNSTNDDQSKILDIIISDLKDLSFQLNNIFYTAELEAGQIEPQAKHTDISFLIDQLLIDYKNFISKKDLKVNVKIENKNEQEVIADSELIRIVLSNLINNAIQYSYNNGMIDIHVLVDQLLLRINIQDYGEGIDEKFHNQIYEPFWQGDMGSTKLHRGHGLGLSIVKEMIAILNGYIEVKSKKGEGARFSICIPINNLDKSNYLGESIDGNIELF